MCLFCGVAEVDSSAGEDESPVSPWVVNDSEIAVRRDDMVMRQAVKDGVVDDFEVKTSQSATCKFTLVSIGRAAALGKGL